MHAEAKGLEALGNCALSSYHYLFSGKKFTSIDHEHLFLYRDPLAIELLKTVAAILTLPISFIIGTALKSLSFLFQEGARKHHFEILEIAKKSSLPPINGGAFLPQERVERIFDRVLRPSEEPTAEQRQVLAPLLHNVSQAHQEEIAALPQAMTKDILALKDLGALLDAHRIPWWVDCGTLLGVYRHEGMIPWDHDIDVAILQEYHDHVLNIASQPEFAQKYRIMDWSPAEEPKTLLKLYVKETGSLIDIYHYKIHRNAPQEDTVSYLSPYYTKWYMPHTLKIREEFCLVTQPLTTLFPLKTTWFDGVEVHVPNRYEEHLKGIYQNELAPAKIWDADLKKYANVPGHPYWDKSNE